MSLPQKTTGCGVDGFVAVPVVGRSFRSPKCQSSGPQGLLLFPVELLFSPLSVDCRDWQCSGGVYVFWLNELNIYWTLSFGKYPGSLCPALLFWEWLNLPWMCPAVKQFMWCGSQDNSKSTSCRVRSISLFHFLKGRWKTILFCSCLVFSLCSVFLDYPRHINICSDREKPLTGRQWEEHPLFVVTTDKPTSCKLFCCLVWGSAEAWRMGFGCLCPPCPAAARMQGFCCFQFGLKPAYLIFSSPVFGFMGRTVKWGVSSCLIVLLLFLPNRLSHNFIAQNSGILPRTVGQEPRRRLRWVVLPGRVCAVAVQCQLGLWSSEGLAGQDIWGSPLQGLGAQPGSSSRVLNLSFPALMSQALWPLYGVWPPHCEHPSMTLWKHHVWLFLSKPWESHSSTFVTFCGPSRSWGHPHSRGGDRDSIPW